MRVNCIIKVNDYKLSTLIQNSSQAVLHVGKYQNYEDNVMLVVTSRYPKGKLYQLQNNVRKVHTRFIHDGKATVYFIHPTEEIQIQGAVPSQLSELLSYVCLTLLPVHRRKPLKEQIIDPRLIKKPCGSSKTKVIDINSLHSKQSLDAATKTLTYVGNMKVVHPKILGMKQLKFLNLSGNQLKQIPCSLGNLHLEEVNFADNNIDSTNCLWLEQLPIRESLRELNLSHNVLSTFPYALVDFMKLRKLNISNNFLTSVPSNLARLSSLRELDISENNIQYLPIAFKVARLSVFTISSKLLLGSVENLRHGGPPLQQSLGGSPLEQALSDPDDNCFSSLRSLALIVASATPGRPLLTATDFPLMMLMEMRNISECICGKRTIPSKKTCNNLPFQLLYVQTVVVVRSTYFSPDSMKNLLGEYHHCCSAHKVRPVAPAVRV